MGRDVHAARRGCTAKRVLSALGGLLLSQVTGAVAAQASTKWGGLFATVASGTVGGVAAAVANNYGNQYALDAGSGMMGGAVLNGLKALLGLSQNNALRDFGSLTRAVQTAPSTTSTTANAANTTNATNATGKTGTTPAVLPSGQTSSGQGTTTPPSSNISASAAPSTSTGTSTTYKTLEVKAYVEGETVRFKTPGGFVQEKALEIREDGWITTQTSEGARLLVDKERMGWKAEDGMVILKGHATYNIEFASDEEKKAGIEKPFYFYDESQEVSGFVELESGANGLIDLDGEMGGFVELDSGEVSGLIDLNDDPLDGYADSYDDDDEEYDDDEE